MDAAVSHLKNPSTNELRANQVVFLLQLLNPIHTRTRQWFSCLQIIKKARTPSRVNPFRFTVLISARRGLFTKMVSHERSKVSGPDAGEFSFHAHLDVTHDGWTPPPVASRIDRGLVACRFPVYRYSAMILFALKEPSKSEIVLPGIKLRFRRILCMSGFFGRCDRCRCLQSMLSRSCGSGDAPL